MSGPEVEVPDALIVFDDTLEATWFIHFHGGDWMGGLSRTADGGLQFKYRWRYYVDDKAHDSADRKSFYGGRWPSNDVKDALRKIAIVLRVIVQGKEGRMYQCIRQGRTTDAMIEEWMSLPFMHARVYEG